MTFHYLCCKSILQYQYLFSIKNVQLFFRFILLFGVYIYVNAAFPVHFSFVCSDWKSMEHRWTLDISDDASPVSGRTCIIVLPRANEWVQCIVMCTCSTPNILLVAVFELYDFFLFICGWRYTRKYICPTHQMKYESVLYNSSRKSTNHR